MTSEKKFEIFCALMWARHGHPMEWPFPYPVRPWFWERTQRRRESQLKSLSGLKLSKDERERYWREVRKGQDVCEDAGGAMIRHFRALFGLSTPVVTTQADELTKMLKMAAGKNRTPEDWDATR